MTQRVAALAKINLALHVGALRPDGYHPVDTLCVFAPGGDTLEIVGPAEAFSLEVIGPEGRGLDTGVSNLILRAAQLLVERTPFQPVRFRLTKQVPVASGIGGGTSNGAAALWLLNRSAGRPLSDEGLMRCAEGLGADGPVCLAPLLSAGSYRAEGIGHAVRPGPVLPPLWVCLANPGDAVPTGTVFRRFDAGVLPSPLFLPAMPPRMQLSDVVRFMEASRNDLAGPARSICPAIADLENRMEAAPGCLAARMSGSGATVFGLFASQGAAKRAARRLQPVTSWAISAPLVSGSDRP